MMKCIRNCISFLLKDCGWRCLIFGVFEEIKLCYLMECFIYGNYLEWLVFSNCSKICGSGIKIRIWNCLNFKFKYGGRDCLKLGLGIEVKGCNI